MIHFRRIINSIIKDNSNLFTFAIMFLTKAKKKMYSHETNLSSNPKYRVIGSQNFPLATQLKKYIPGAPSLPKKLNLFKNENK